MLLYGLFVCLLFSGILAESDSVNSEVDSVDLPDSDINLKRKFKKVNPVWPYSSEKLDIKAGSSINDDGLDLKPKPGVYQYTVNSGNEETPWNYGNLENSQNGQQAQGYYLGQNGQHNQYGQYGHHGSYPATGTGT